jgi:hypothetical protein
MSNLAVFKGFNIKNRMENIKLLRTAISNIKNAAPLLSKVLRSLNHPIYAKSNNLVKDAVLIPRHLLILFVIYTSLHRKKYTNLPTLFSIYLFNGGATKRVIKTYS